jgi:tetratricopeptide (TPR) repeat protein
MDSVAHGKSVQRGRAPAPPTAAQPAGLAPRWRVCAVCLFLLAITWTVFGQTVHFAFVNFDDQKYVTENRLVLDGLTFRGLAWVFTHPECNFFHPLTLLSLMLDAQLHGLDAGGYHLTNVLIHAAAAVLLFLVLRDLTGAFWRSAFVAAVFAIHPLRVESVAWVAERKDVLGAFFFMLTLGAYARYARPPASPRRYWPVAGFFLLDLLCKPTAAALPLVLLLLDYWPLGRMAPGARSSRGVPIWALVKEKIPLAALAAAAGVVAYLAEGETVIPVARISIPMRLGNALISCVTYLGQMFWPTRLAVFYPYPEHHYPLWETAPAFLLLAAITAGVLAFWRTRPWLLTGWFWYLALLAPVIGLVQVGEFAHADRNTYLPQIGLYVMLAWSASALASAWRGGRVVLIFCSVVILAALVARARAQTAFWRDSETLWRHELACTTNNYFALDNLGVSYAKQGKLADAVAQYHQALAIKPGYARAYYNLGTALFEQGDTSGAIAEFGQALTNSPNFAEAHMNLGVALVKAKRIEEAIAQYQKALELDPENAQTHNDLGLALAVQGQADAAISQYRTVLELRPDYAEIHSNLGEALDSQGNLEAAIAQYQEALALQPRLAGARQDLGRALLRKGEFAAALPYFQQTSASHADALTQWSALGDDLVKKQDLAEAIICYQQALNISPRFADICNKLGAACYKIGETQEAIAAWQRSLEIHPDQVYVLNNLAWALATTPDASLRDGAKAIALAQKAEKSGGGPDNPLVLHTLAAAYAEEGSYTLAAATAGRALELATAQKDEPLAASLQREIKLYEAGAPVRDRIPGQNGGRK